MMIALMSQYVVCGAIACAPPPPTPPLEYAWIIKENVAARLASDLLLESGSEARAIYDTLFETYKQRCESKRHELHEDVGQLYQQLLHEFGGPEIDEDYDITELPVDEQAHILRIRALLRQGTVPFLDEPRFMDPLEELAERVTLELVAHERKQRNEFTLACLELASDEMRPEVAARALRRLTINMHALVFLGAAGASRSDPIWKLDILKLLEEAARPRNELDAWSEVILDAETAVGVHDGLLGEVAALIAVFETEYGALVSAYEGDQRFKWGVARLRENRHGNDAAAHALAERDARKRAEILRRRRRFAQELDAVLRQADPERADRWIERYRAADCRSLFLADSVDEVVGRLRGLGDLHEDERELVNAIYARYTNDRTSLRDRAYDLELEDFAVRSREHSESINRKKVALSRVHQDRVDLAQRTLGQVRAVLDVSHQLFFDEVVAAYRAQAARSIETRP